MPHDLAVYLAEVTANYEGPIVHVDVCWAEVVPERNGKACWAWLYYPDHDHPRPTIVLNKRLARAPAYVVKYVILHEYMHFLQPPRRGKAHHRSFRIAEQTYPTHRKANQWLDAHNA